MGSKYGFRTLSASRLGGLFLLLALLSAACACDKTPSTPPDEGTTPPAVTATQTEEATEGATEGTNEEETAKEDTLPTLTIRDAEVGAGEDTVQVELHLLNNPGLAGMQFTLHYGEELILTDVDFDDRFGVYTAAPTPYENPQLLTFAAPLKDVSEEGLFATLTFRVAAGTPANTDVRLFARIVEENTCNGDLEEVEFRVTDGVVRIPAGNPTPDADGGH